MAASVAAMGASHSLAELDAMASSRSLAAPDRRPGPGATRRRPSPPPPGWTPTPISYPASAPDLPPRWIDACRDDAIGSLAVYRARYAATPVSGGTSIPTSAADGWR